MQQNTQKDRMRLYIPTSRNLYPNYTKTISPTNIQFSPYHHSPISSYRYRINNYQPSRKDKIQSLRNSRKYNPKNSIWQQKKISNKQPIDYQKKSISRMLQQSRNMESYDWQKIYKFFTKSSGVAKLPKTRREINISKNQHLGETLNVQQMKPSPNNKTKKRYAPTAAQPRRKCINNITININQEQRPNSFTHHRFISTSQSKRKGKTMLLKDNHLSRPPSQNKDSINIRNSLNIDQNWVVDSWKTNTRNSQMGDLLTQS